MFENILDDPITLSIVSAIGMALLSVIAVSVVLFLRLRAGSGFSSLNTNNHQDQDGIIAVGVVTDRTPTAVMVNDVRVYRISLEVDNGQETWTAQIKAPLLPEELYTTTPGSKLPVKYQQRKPQRVVYAPESFDQMGQLAQQIRVRKGLADPSIPEIEARGVDGQAVIQSLVPTGVTKEGESEFTLTVVMVDRTGQQITMTKNIYLHYQEAAEWAPGRAIPIRYIPGTEKFFTTSLLP